jgi:hypothetical protein
MSQSNPTLAAIAAQVAEFHGLSPTELQQSTRAREVARPRQIAMYFMRELTDSTLLEVARFFAKKDHATVSYAVKLIKNDLAVSPSTAATISRLAAKLQHALSDPMPTPLLPESSDPPEDPAAPPVIQKPRPAPVQVIDDSPEEDLAELARENAFSAVYEWPEGTPLMPWAFCRESVFLSQRRSLGAPSLEQINGDLASFLSDAARILWLCTHDESEITVLRGKPHLMQQVIDAWAEEAIPRGTRQEACDIALEIHNTGSINQPTAVDDGTPSGN